MIAVQVERNSFILNVFLIGADMTCRWIIFGRWGKEDSEMSPSISLWAIGGIYEELVRKKDNEFGRECIKRDCH